MKSKTCTLTSYVKVLIISSLICFTFNTTVSYAGGTMTVKRGPQAAGVQINWNVQGGSQTCAGTTNYTFLTDNIKSSWEAVQPANGTINWTSVLGTSSMSMAAASTSFTFTCTDGSSAAFDTVTLIVEDCYLGETWNGTSCVALPAPVVTSFNNSSPIAYNTTATTTWTSTNNGTCSIDNGIGGGLPANGSTTTPALTVSTTYTISCTNGGGSDTRQTTVTVGAPIPDLTAEEATAADAWNATPILDATKNDPITFSVIVRNIGSATTGTGFNYFFQVSDATNGTGAITDLSPSAMASIASGSNRTATVVHAFPASITYSIRACADKANAADAGAINESNEINNCGLWVDVLVHDTSGTLSRSPALCRVPDNNDRCASNFDWSTAFIMTGTTSSVFRDGTATALSTANAGTNVPFNAIYPSSTFRLRHIGAEIAPSVSVTAECNDSSAWKVSASQCKLCQNGGCNLTPHVCDNGGFAPDCVPVPVCVLPNRLDSINNVCANPDISSLIFEGEYYPNAPEAPLLKLSCSDSLDYAIYRNGATYVATSTYSAPFVSTVPASQTDTYTFACIHGNIYSTTSRIYHFSPTLSDQNISKFSLSTNSVTPGGKLTISWLMKFPTSACSLTARVVCPNNACNTAQQAYQTRINSELSGSSTDALPAGSRPIQTAVRTVAPGAQYGPPQWLAAGSRTTIVDFTTDFTYNCGPTLIQTRRVNATRSDEQ